MVRRLTFALLVAGCLGSAATLERLSLDEMIETSTAIVRGRITGSWPAMSGRMVYTHYRLQVAERWKGGQQAEIEFVVPGGTVNNVRQIVDGAPQLSTGREYLLFLWTSKLSHLTYVLGFTQGIFTLSGDEAVRDASAELMLERGTGRVVRGERIQMRMRDLGSRITMRLGGKGGVQ